MIDRHGQDDTRIDDLKSQLEDSGFEPTTRGALADDLHVANQINGDPDSVKQLIKTMIIQNVRREIIVHKKLQSHFTNCIVARQVKTLADGTVIYPWQKPSESQKIDIQVVEDGKDSTFQLWKIKVTGPAVKYAIITTGVIGLAWMMIYRQDMAMQKMKESVIPEIVKSVTATIASNTEESK
jgi:hypothetical protein